MTWDLASLPWRSWLFDFVFYYPFLMSCLWMAGGLWHALFFERNQKAEADPLEQLQDTPLVTVVVPCYNEAAQIYQVIHQLMCTRYPNFEVIAVNDGSKDDTGAILDKLALELPRLRVIHNASNQGKAVGLNTAALLARGEYLFGIDGDALIDPDAIGWLVLAMEQDADIGAITGNPRIRNRTTILGRMQVGEFSSIIGLIKRTQQLWGRLFTVSGVITMFRRRALLDVGFWSTDMLTEDIDVSWKLQLAGWEVRFEPRALSWILMPETVRGLWKQRLRWAMGGIQTVLRHGGAMLSLRQWRMWPIFAEYLVSVCWAYAMCMVLAMALLARLLPDVISDTWRTGFVPEWHGTLLALVCLMQIAISLWIDRRYDRDPVRHLKAALWYPIAFWMITMLTTVYALPAVWLRRSGKRAVWSSPDRGVATHHEHTV